MWGALVYVMRSPISCGDLCFLGELIALGRAERAAATVKPRQMHSKVTKRTLQTT